LGTQRAVDGMSTAVLVLQRCQAIARIGISAFRGSTRKTYADSARETASYIVGFR
jgi:hypothetical protein